MSPGAGPSTALWPAGHRGLSGPSSHFLTHNTVTLVEAAFFGAPASARGLLGFPALLSLASLSVPWEWISTSLPNSVESSEGPCRGRVWALLRRGVAGWHTG